MFRNWYIGNIFKIFPVTAFTFLKVYNTFNNTVYKLFWLLKKHSKKNITSISKKNISFILEAL